MVIVVVVVLLSGRWSSAWPSRLATLSVLRKLCDKSSSISVEADLNALLAAALADRAERARISMDRPFVV